MHSAHMAHGCPLCWHPVPLGKVKGTVSAPAEAPFRSPPIRATSFRKGGRNHLGTPSDIKSDWWATSSRIRERLRPKSALKAIREDMLDRMHTPVREQHRWLRQVLRGHYQYYGVIFNYRALRMFKDCVVRLWRKTLGKRSQKGRVTWASYTRLLAAFPPPEPVIQQAWHR